MCLYVNRSLFHLVLCLVKSIFLISLLLQFLDLGDYFEIVFRIKFLGMRAAVEGIQLKLSPVNLK